MSVYCQKAAARPRRKPSDPDDAAVMRDPGEEHVILFYQSMSGCAVYFWQHQGT